MRQITGYIIIYPNQVFRSLRSRKFRSFESGDTLEHVRYLYSLKDSTTELFLVEEPLEQKIKLQVTYAVRIIPVILTVIQTVINFKGT